LIGYEKMGDKINKEKAVFLSPHAREKLKRLSQIGITEEKTIQTVQNPEIISPGYFGRKIAQATLTNVLLLRVVYEETDNNILVITMYPAERRRYE
jgi:hypothetical protein